MSRTIGITIFAIVWSSVTVMADVTFVTNAVAQARTSAFASTTGTIVEIAAEKRRSGGRKSPTRHRVNLRYKYRVQDNEYEQTQYRATGNNLDDDWINRLVASLSPGTSVTVYYDPANPAEAVLDNRLIARDVLPLFLFLPFNLVIVGLAYGGIAAVLRRRAIKHNGGVRVTRMKRSVSA